MVVRKGGEDVLYNHQVSKGRNRDNGLVSILDEQWPHLRSPPAG